MTTEGVRQLLHAAPFVPFTIFLPANKSYRIEHPDFATISKGGGVMAVSLEGDAFALIDLMLATHIETHPTASNAIQN
jgi:hypothetical protein